MNAENPQPLSETIPYLAGAIQKLEPGELSRLCRNPLLGGGSAAFWYLVAERGLRCHTDEWQEKWAAVIQGMALMTPKGDPAKRTRSAHDANRPVGAVLANPGSEKLGLSELRLSQLLTARGDMRRKLAIRVCRMLSAQDAPCHWGQMAQLILYGKESIKRRIASDYYRTLHAQQTPKQTSTG